MPGFFYPFSVLWSCFCCHFFPGRKYFLLSPLFARDFCLEWLTEGCSKRTFRGPPSRRFRRIRKCFKMRPSGPTKELVPPKEEKSKELAFRRKEQMPPKDIVRGLNFQKNTTRRTKSLPKKEVNKKTQSAPKVEIANQDQSPPKESTKNDQSPPKKVKKQTSTKTNCAVVENPANMHCENLGDGQWVRPSS